MNGTFGFDLPNKSAKLEDKEYVNLVNRLRGNFLSYVSVLDSILGVIISDIFLRDKTDIALWANTVFDDDRVSFGTKIIWLLKIISNSELASSMENEDRQRLEKNLHKIRNIRNDFAHNFAYNKQVEPDDIKNRVIRLYDFEEGITTTKLFKMEEIMDIINDSWLLKQLEALQVTARRIREK